MKIAILQYAQNWNDPKASLKKIESLIDEYITDEELLILPEMSVTGYTMDSREFAEEIDGISTRYFCEKSASLKKHIFAGIIEKDNGKIYNSLVHFDTQGLITVRYRKIHPFTLAEEEKHYSAGKEIVVTSINKINFGLTICYDLRFPELYRLLAKDGAKVLVNIASWPVKRIEHWKTFLKAHAIANQAYFVGVNRVGNDPYHPYNGNSTVVDPMGEIICTNKGDETVLKAELDFEMLDNVRKGFGFLNDIKLI